MLSKCLKKLTIFSLLLFLIAGLGAYENKEEILSLIKKQKEVKLKENKNIEILRNNLMKLDTKAINYEISEIDLDNFFKVNTGTEIFYTNKEATHLFYGLGVKVVNSEKVIYLNDQEENKKRADYLSLIKKDNAIEFLSDDEKIKLYVFTDITCPYCKRLHEDIEAINAAGISVQYFPYPRVGLNSQTELDLQKIWCSGNEQEYHNAFTDKNWNSKTIKCDNYYPVSYYYNLANKMGIKGTPFIITEEGEAINGYQNFNSFFRSIKGLTW